MVETQKNALRLTAVDEAAAGAGLGVGMTLSDARARVPGLVVAQADAAADLALLMRLGEACRRFTPALALQAPDGLDLDVTGCTALFGGEARLLMAARAVMQRAGVAVRAALADTSALAYAAARFGAGGVVAAGAGAAVLAPLPVEALRLEAGGCAVLRQLGFKRIGQILALPRASLARRLGPEALHRLDEALGARGDPLELSLEQPPFRAERRMFEPVSEVEQVLQVGADLAADLAVQLEGRAVGGRRFTLELFRMDGAVQRLSVAASRPLRRPDLICALFAERLAGLNDGLQADFGFDQLRLTAVHTQPTGVDACDLLQEIAAPGAVEALADRLAARSGSAPRRLAQVDLHTPERAQAETPLATAKPWSAEPARFLDTPLRPFRLFHPPQPIEVPLAALPEGPPARFVWRRVSRTVVRAEGPERLEPEWAQRSLEDLVRDYYRLEDETGRRYWVFRQRRYDAPDAPAPRAAREEIKPVRAPPRPSPEFKLQLVSASPSLERSLPLDGGRAGVGVQRRRQPEVRNSARSGLRSAVTPIPDPSPIEGEGRACVPAPRPAAPAWFLHGLFG